MAFLASLCFESHFVRLGFNITIKGTKGVAATVLDKVDCNAFATCEALLEYIQQRTKDFADIDIRDIFLASTKLGQISYNFKNLRRCLDERKKGAVRMLSFCCALSAQVHRVFLATCCCRRAVVC